MIEFGYEWIDETNILTYATIDGESPTYSNGGIRWHSAGWLDDWLLDVAEFYDRRGTEPA